MPRLAQMLAAVINRTLAPTAAQRRLRDRLLAPLLRALAGRQVPTAHALLSFGQGNQFGDVTISDVAGGNLTRLHLRGDVVLGNKVLRFGLGAALVLALALLGAAAIWNIEPLKPLVRRAWWQVFPPFAAAQPGESLIIVAEFNDMTGDTARGDNPALSLYHDLRDQIARDGLPIRVERLYEALDANTVRQTGAAYSATLVLWGEYSSAAAIPVLERMRIPQQYMTDEEGAFLTIADPTSIQIGELSNMAAVGSYITLFTLGAERYTAEAYADARAYLTSAIDAVPSEQAVQVRPDEAYFLRGNLALLREQEYKAAVRDYEAVLALSPNNAPTLNNLGIALHSLGDYGQARAYYEQSLSIARTLGDRQDEVHALNNLAAIAIDQGEYAQALVYQTQVMTLMRVQGYPQGEVSTFLSLGAIASSQGYYTQAHEYHIQALALTRALGDDQTEAAVITGLGFIAENQGDYALAQEYYNQAAIRTFNLGDRRGMARAFNGLGNVALKRGEYAVAYACYDMAWSGAHELGDRLLEAHTLNGLGNVASKRGKYAAAHEYYTQALTLAHTLGTRQAEVNALNGLSSLTLGQADYTQARAYSMQALDLTRVLGDRQSEAHALNGLGAIAHEQDDYRQAHEYYTQALTLTRALGDRQSEAAVLNGLGTITHRQGNYVQAHKYYERALTIQRDLGARADGALTSWNLGLVYQAQGDMARAMPLMQERIDFYIEIDHPDAADGADYLCWYGSLSGIAAAVTATCEQAVALSPDKHENRSSRGLNRALTGDTTDAIDDFQFFVDQMRRSPPTELDRATTAALIASAEAWIAALKAGENPFDAATLAALREE